MAKCYKPRPSARLITPTLIIPDIKFNQVQVLVQVYLLITDMSSRFFENQPNEICSHLRDKASKGTFLKPEKLQNHSNEEKGKEKRKSEEKERRRRKKKAMVALLVFGQKKLLDTKGLLSDNVIKNPARYNIKKLLQSNMTDLQVTKTNRGGSVSKF